MILLLLAGAGLSVRYVKGVVRGEEFAGAVRGVILANPMMRDPELRERVARAAGKVGVALDPASVQIERGGASASAGGGITAVRVRFVVPIDLYAFTLRREVSLVVEP